MITSFLAIFQSTFFQIQAKKHTFNCLYNANLFKTSCSTPFRLILCLEPITAVICQISIVLFSKTRLKYYFNTAHCYQDLHCSLMYRCPTAVLALLCPKDYAWTAKSAFHYNLYTLYPAITCRAVHCQLSNIPLHQLLATLAPLVHPWFSPNLPPRVLVQFAASQFSSNLSIFFLLL